MRIIFLIMITILIINACSTKSLKSVFKKELMYTIFDIVIYSELSKKQLTNHIQQIWNYLDQLEYDLTSTGSGMLGTLNKKSFISKIEYPENFIILSNFIEDSIILNKKSNGAFDLTVYPLVRLWGFYIQDEKQKVPSQKVLLQAMKSVGMNNIIFTNNGIQLLNNAQLDLGAIAKGYAVDKAIEMLTNHQDIKAGIVNAGGNLRVFGQKPDRSPWRVGIRNPNGEEVKDIITLYDGEAIATSGDYEKYFIIDDQYYHHIFNPKTGKPVTHKLASVSVVFTNSAMMSDILATTLLSLGTQKAQEFIKKYYNNKIPWFLIERNNKELITKENQWWTERRK